MPLASKPRSNGPLSSARVAELRLHHGYNELAETQPVPLWRKFLGQFKDLVIGILIVAAILSGLLGEWTDMFVDEMGALRRLPRNDAATRIYRNGFLSKRPDDDPEKLPYIAGPAVVFLRPVWGH